ncbi:hypothetical protein GLAREA_05769 [Glarea lozoyensis ATCC 20868]|uniref:Uncharacterized protein n=1 Tax=Glarea lozoyensis (strain ATCC 20868 / MF5171) TaxID=1116229 RepID=S3DWV7_GLAL2|nr:uncharacterized protein GLAREA_05769 [Glarea lozoyensis ATCC 20868]EPE36431.1 hypothetical protein GLAREA_05769 [Glarea lozoyensis ATCC 20868]
MRSFFSIASLAVLGFTSIAQATEMPPPSDECSKDFACCANPSKRSLFRRTTNTCSTKTCCQTTENILTANTKTELRCGKYGAKTSTVTVTVRDCPTTTDGKCIHVAYENVVTTTFNEVHLQIDDVNLTASAPGQFTFNKYCSLTNSNQTADCWVAVSKVLDVFSPPVTSLCDKSIRIAAHASITDGNTCWGVGSPIAQTSKNWAMELQSPSLVLQFAQSPAVVQQSLHHLQPQRSADSVPPSPIIPYALATVHHHALGGNDVTKGTHVGTATVSKGTTAGTVRIAYDLDSGYQVNVAHVLLTCAPVPVPPQGANPNCAPGKYTINSGCITGASRQHWSTDYKITCSRYYLIMHGSITRTVPSTDTCTAVDCSYVDPPDQGEK